MYGFSADYHTQCLLAAKGVIHKFPKFDRIQFVTDPYMVLILCYFALAEKMGIAHDKTKGLISVGADRNLSK